MVGNSAWFVEVEEEQEKDEDGLGSTREDTSPELQRSSELQASIKRESA